MAESMRRERRLFGLLLLVLGLVLTPLSAMVAINGFRERLIERDFAQLQRDFDPVAWRRLIERGDALPKLSPWNPDMYELSGRIHWVTAERHAASPREQISHLRIALSRFEHAAKLRPTAIFSWINLADVQYRLNPTQDDWKRSVDRALGMDVRGNSVQYRLLALREQMEQRLSPEQTERFAASLRLGLKDDPWPLLGFLAPRNRLGWACAMPDVPALAKAICRESFGWIHEG